MTQIPKTRSFSLVLMAALALGGAVALPTTAAAQNGEEASLARGAVPDTTPQQRYQTAIREVKEETGIDAQQPGCFLHDWGLENQYDIYPAWRWRYAPEVSRNTERIFGLRVPEKLPITLSPTEHTEWQWQSWQAAADQCFSPSNAEAILMLPRFLKPVG